MKSKMTFVKVALVSGELAVFSVACERHDRTGAAEDAVEQAEDAAERAADKVEDTTESTADRLERERAAEKLEHNARENGLVADHPETPRRFWGSGNDQIVQPEISHKIPECLRPFKRNCEREAL